MAAGDTPITLVGNLTDDPELKFTSTGVAVAKFRVASTPRFMDRQTGEWKDGEALFMRCTVWRQMAEHAAESLQRGARVVVVGRLRQNNYETTAGEKRTSIEVEVDEVGPSLKFATATVNKMARSGGGDNRGNDNREAPASRPAPAPARGGFADDPWANTAPSAPQQSTTQGGFDDEPPY